MNEYLIGTGGWAYFHVPGLNSLVAYSRAFDFVEVNSTFYQIPPLEKVRKWRQTVPSNFHFAVRAHRTVTHKSKFEPNHEAIEALRQMKQICDILKADVLHLQTPPSIRLTEAKLENFLKAASSQIDFGETKLALEIRGKQASGLPADLAKTMKDSDVIHCVDVSKGEMPAYRSDTLYTRLFGKGEHNVYQPTDGELAEIDRRVTNSGSGRIAMSFHFVRMYKDAARMKMYKQTGAFPKITGFTGAASLAEVLKEDARFPSTKQELIQSQGWKLFDLNRDERVHARDYLEQLPERTYDNIEEVMDILQAR